MKVIIAGAGVAGSYLALRLSRRWEVEVLDEEPAERLGRECAWGINGDVLEEYCGKAGLSAGRYVLNRCTSFRSEMYSNHRMVVFDKNRFLRDLLQQCRATFRPQPAGAGRLESLDCDIVVDATGARRALLPRCLGREEWMLPCYQVEADSSALPLGVWIEGAGIGYLWVFPLRDGRRAKVGCGSFTVNPRATVRAFLRNAGVEALQDSEVGSVIRCLPPARSRPFWRAGRPFLVGAGESIGTVSPLTGEGTAHSLRCAELLAASLQGVDSALGLERAARLYERRVLREFKWIETQHAFLRAVRSRHPLAMLVRLLRLRQPRRRMLTYPRLRHLCAHLRRRLHT